MSEVLDRFKGDQVVHMMLYLWYLPSLQAQSLLDLFSLSVFIKFNPL